MTYNTRTAGSSSPIPSIYSPLVSQAIYWDDLWRAAEQGTDFAHRTQHFLGSYSSSAISFDSGPDKTRKTTGGSSSTDQKYVIGEEHIGMALRGGVWNKTDAANQDVWNVLGSTSIGMASIRDHDELEPGSLGKPWNRRMHLNQVTGTENAALLARVLRPALTDTSKPGPIDLREGYWQEDGAVNISPAIIQAMFGASNLVFLDNKRSSYCSILPPDAPYSSGYVENAIGTRSLICAFTKGSWVNANHTFSFQGGLHVGDAWSADDGWFCGDNETERPGSVIRNYTGIDIYAPAVHYCEPIEIRSARGFSFYDFNPGESGGAAPLVAGNVDEQFRNMAAEPEKHGNFVRGSLIVGDSSSRGTGNSGYDTDVLHVRDVVHLTPRTNPPVFDENLPPSERVGLLYFDLERNCLRVSVAAHNPALSQQEDWRQSEVVWVDLSMNFDQVVPATDVVGAEKSADSLAYKSSQELDDAMEYSKVAAKEGTSPFQHPRLEISDPVLADSTTASFNLLYSGFRRETPFVYWRLRSTGANQQIEETHWTKLGEAELSPIDGLGEASGAAVVVIAPTETDDDGNSVPLTCSGKTLQLFAINPISGQCTGTSIGL